MNQTTPAKPKTALPDYVKTAKEKRELLLSFFQSVQRGGEVLSTEDLEIAVESLKLAQLDIREREERRRREEEAALLLKKEREKEERRRQAAIRAERRARRKHEEYVKKVTAMDLPMDFVNQYDEDERADLHCDSISDALLVSLDALGIVDIEFISQITGEEMKTVIESLRGSIYQNPLHWDECFYKGWETADEYLSGNLTHKYHLAKEANERYLGHFDRNVEALEKLINPAIAVEDIYITLGSPWVPWDIIDEFILHLVGLEPMNDIYPEDAKVYLTSDYAVRHDEVTGMWQIPRKNRFRRSSEHGKYDHLNYQVWGTQRMDMLTLLENTLNMKTLSIFDTPDPDSKARLLNQNETVKILEKQEKMIAEFRQWAWLDPKRARRLQGAYCRRYGNIRPRVFDGSFLEFPDMNPRITLKPHQKNSVARILFTPNTLLAHDVGAGKTFTMIAAGMELRRLGKSKKNLYVIPNNIMPQWVSMFNLLYPKANLLVVDRKNFNAKRRSATLQMIVDNDYDAILMTYSCFDMLSLSKRYYRDLYEARLKKLDKARTTFYTKGKIDKRREVVLKALQKLQDDMTENVCELAFDELGINTLFVDEAHNYKNVSVHTRISHVRGLSGSGSKKCDAMMDKVHCVQRQNHGGRVILATGTPITNSITDLFVLQKYLQDGELEFMSVHNFDSWVGMYARKVTEFEIDVDTNNYHLATRFSRFYNVPELTALLSSVADFYRVDEAMGLPEFEGYTDSVKPGSKDFKDYLRGISTRADDVRQKRVDRHEDNLLKITTDGRKAALDMRLIDPAFGLDPDSKVFRCAENIMEIYEQTRDRRCIQMVFCDIGTPKSRFNLYDELKGLLKAMGMPEGHIAYIHDADTEDQKRLLFHDLQCGNIAVVVGSTFKMGLGVNVQERLIALHHLDVPWRPADMVQREGRILRQGNTCDAVKIYRYITKGSFDAYSWQLLETKQRFISQILSGHATVREGDDVDEAVLNYAEVKALSVGNPLIKRRVEVINELDKYRILHRDFVRAREESLRTLEALPEKIRLQEAKIAATQEDIDYYAANKIDYDALSYKEQKTIRSTIHEAALTHRNKPNEKLALVYQGFKVVVPARMIPKVRNASDPDKREELPYVFVKRASVYYMEIASEAGITTRLNNLLEGLEDFKQRREKELRDLQFLKEKIEEDLQTTEQSFTTEIEALTEELDSLNISLGVIAS